MANDVVNFPNSFIQFRTGSAPAADCQVAYDVALPIRFFADIAFSYLLTNPTQPTGGGFNPATIAINFAFFRRTMEIGELNTVLCDGSPCQINTMPQKGVDLGDGTILMLAKGRDDCFVYPTLSEASGFHVDDGDCIYIAAFDEDGTIVATSDQAFYFTSDTCFTKVVQYKCDENSFGFLFESAITGAALFTNSWKPSIRLPITLYASQFPKKKKVFRKSDSSYVKLSVVMEEETEGLVDRLTKFLHKCLTVALECDNVYIGDPAATCTIQEYQMDEGEEYLIDWKDSPGNYLGIAQANFKAKTDPFFNENCNCG